MRRIFQVSALLLGLTGCSLTIDADGVPPPVPGSCTPVCTAALICGVTLNNCGTTCAAGSGCTAGGTTHTLQGQLTPAAGAASATGGHSVARGILDGSAGSTAAASGHSISQGTLSP